MKFIGLMKSNKILSLTLLFTFICMTAPQLAWSTKHHGRITLGSFASKETFTDNIDQTERNDFATTSTRMFLDVSEMGKSNYQLVMDLRDKHDFFDKLDREKKELQDSNTFQVRQLYVHQPKLFEKMFYRLGRFAVSKAGAIFTDGLEVGFQPSSSWDLALFGGLNPKRPDQTYLQSNPDSSVYGLYLNYQPEGRSWQRFFYVTTAYVTQTFKSEVDRQYLYQNLVYQWSSQNRIYTLLYLDFVPRTYVQIGHASLQKTLGKNIDANFRISTFDVIEYKRRQDLRETLEPSPYKENRLSMRLKLRPTLQLKASYRQGERAADNLQRRVSTVGLHMPRLFSKRIDGSISAGSRYDFTKEGQFSRADIGYFSSKWELSFDIESATESLQDGTKLRPLIIGLNISRQISQKLFAAFSYQNAKDETVNITSMFFKVAYRFGNKEISPLRDGASPRGRL